MRFSHAGTHTRRRCRPYEVTAKKGGKVTVTTKVAISADGKSRTSTQTGTGVDGKPVNNSIVYEKP